MESTEKQDTNDSKNTSIHPSISPWQQLFNAFLANFWVGPLVVMYWSSTWNLVVREIIFPDDIYLSIWVSAGIGFGIYFFSSCLQAQFYSWSRPKHTGVVSVFVALLASRVYTYVLAFASVNQWRAIWNGWDVYTSSNEYNAVFTALGSCLALFLLRCFKQILAPPVVVGLDVPLKTYYETSTYFGTKVCTWQHVLDSLFTATVVPLAVVTAWRGVWYMSDIWITPDDMLVSAGWSLAFAYGLEGLLLVTRGAWVRLSFWSDRCHWLFRYLVEDIHSFLHSLVSILHWRGFWILFEQDLLGYPLQFWLFHAISYTLLTITLCSNSIVPTGCSMDARESRGQGIHLDMYYVTNLLKLWEKSHPKSRREGDQGKSWTSSVDAVQMENVA